MEHHSTELCQRSREKRADEGSVISDLLNPVLSSETSRPQRIGYVNLKNLYEAVSVGDVPFVVIFATTLP